MADQAGSRKGRRWFLGCGVAAAVVIVMVVLSAIGTMVFMKPKHATMGSLSRTADYEMAQAPSAQAAMETMPGAPGGAEGGAADKATNAPFLTSAAHADEARSEIIYTAQMTVEVDDVDAATEQVLSTVKSAGGRLGGKDAYVHDSGDRTTTITVRVPAGKFDSVMAELRKLGDVRSESIKAEDVTRQMVDLEARLKNLRREEEVVAELFKRQGKITDVLQVEQELSRVRGQIEQIQGEWNYLRESVSYSTITVTLNTKPSKVVQKLNEWNLGYHVMRAWHALVTVARALTYAVIYTGIVVGPFVLLGLIIWWAIRARRRSIPPPNTAA